MVQTAGVNLNRNQVVKNRMQTKKREGISVLKEKRVRRREEAAPAAIQTEKCRIDTKLLLRVKKKRKRKKRRRISGQNNAIQARNTAKRKGDIGVLHRLLARAQALFQHITKVAGRSIVGEKEVTAHRQNSGKDIVGIVGKKAGQEVDHHESTAAVKRNWGALVNQRVILVAELLVGISLQNIVGNTQRKSIVGNEDLPVHHLTNGTVRGAENIRRESRDPVDHQGGLYFILFLCCVHVCPLYCIESKLSFSQNRFVGTGLGYNAIHKHIPKVGTS